MLTLRGGGLPSARTTSIDRTAFAVPATRVQRTATAVAAAETRSAELALWSAWLPIALGVAAARSSASPCATVAVWRHPRTTTPYPSPPADHPPGTRQGAPPMPFVEQTVRPLTILGAIGVVTALALTGCAANPSSATDDAVGLRQGRPRRRSR